MSEIEKYKKALNFRANPRYLTRDFIVPLYTGTEPDIVPETNVDSGMVVDPSRILPKNFTDDMPFVTDENNTEQLELADGGSVERQGYSFAGLVKETKNKLTNESNPQKKFQLKKRLNFLEDLQKKSKNIQGSKSIENLVSKKDKLGRPFFSDYLEKINALEDLQNNKYLNPKTNKTFTPQEWLKASPSYRSKFRDPETFREKKKEYQKEYMRERKLEDPEFAEKQKTIRKEAYYSAERKNKKGKKGERVLTEQRNKLLGYLSKAAENNPNYKKITKEGQLVGVTDKLNGINYYESGYKGKLGKNSKLITQHPDYNDVNNLAKLADRFKRELPNKAIASYFSAYERVPTMSEMYNFLQSDPRFVEKMSPKFFQTNALHLHHQVSVTESPSQKIQLLLQDRNDQAGKKLIEFQKGNITEEQLNKDLKKLNTKYYVDGKPLGAMETSPEIQLRTAKGQTTRLFNQRLQENPELVEQMTGRLGIKELTQKLDENPELVKAFYKGAGLVCRRKMGGKIDNECLAENIVKEVEKLETGTDLQKASAINKFKKAGKLAAQTGDNAYDIIVGLGAGTAGKVFGSLASLSAGLSEASKGSYKEAARDIGRFLTPFSNEDTYGTYLDDVISNAKEEGKNIEPLLNFKNLINYKKEIKNLDQQIENLKTSPQTQDPLAGDTGVYSDPNKFLDELMTKRKNLSQQYSETRKNITPEAIAKVKNEYLLKTGKDYTSRFFPNVLGQVGPNEKDIVYNIAENRFIDDYSKLLSDEKAGEYKATKFIEGVDYDRTEEDIDATYESGARGGAAEGGRIGLKEGTKIGKRGFLKAAAALALTPEIIKAIKGAGQTGKIASKIKIEPAEGMYPWFPKLVEKVKEMGKPFEEKQLIMEPSYKNSPRPFTSRPPTGEEKLTKHVDGDTTFILREYPDGRLAVDIDSPRNQQSFGQPVSLYYRPKMEMQNYKGEKKIEPPEFKVLEPEPRPFVTGPDDVDITFTEIPKNPKRDIVFADIEAAERFATGNIKNRKIIPVKQSLRNEMEEDPSTFIMRESGELGSKARPEEIIKLPEPEEFATGGRVGFGDGSKDPNRLIPIDPLLQDQSPTDPGKREVLKLGIAGAGILGLGKLGLLKLGSSIKPSVFAEAVKGTTAPSWMDGLMTKILTEGTEIKMPKESSIIKKEVKFKNPETGDVQKATLTIDSKEDRMFIEYDSPTNVANQPVVLELSRERKVVPNPGGKSNWFAPDKTKGYNFYATETGPRVTDWDGTIEFDAEDTAFKIIDLKSDISGLKSYATGGKGIDKKIAKQKRAATADIEKNPEEYVPDWEPEIYD